MTMNEQDLRLRLLNTLLTTPHRDLDAVYLVHKEIIEQDPRFYVQLAAWYAAEGEVRDHKEMFVVSLARSDFPGHRDVGLALLREMPPYQVGRVFDFVKGQTIRRRVKRGDRVEVVAEKRGLYANVPRSMKTEITRYLREREADAAWFDSSVLQARQAMKRLYASLHIAPSPRAQAILFDDDPPPDSRLYALKRIARARTPAEQARAIVDRAWRKQAPGGVKLQAPVFDKQVLANFAVVFFQVIKHGFSPFCYAGHSFTSTYGFATMARFSKRHYLLAISRLLPGSSGLCDLF